MKVVQDKSVDSLDLKKPENLCELLGFLCAQLVKLPASTAVTERLSQHCKKLATRGLGMRDLNELLILSGQNLISAGFYEEFFRDQTKSLSAADLKKGVSKFRMMAMLSHGNFRYPFQVWRLLNRDKIQVKLGDLALTPAQLLERFPGRMVRINRIPNNKTYATGALSARLVIQEFQVALGLCEAMGLEYDPAETIDAARKSGLIRADETLEAKQTGQPTKSLKARWKRDYAKRAVNLLAERIHEVGKTRSTAKEHLTDYLLTPNIDLYVATSMRETWEFEETAQDLEKLFEKKRFKFLKNLDYFDPTQCYCESPVDKGLVEGLVLSRVKATLYMAQESDTLGKDSELASTLARGKPVIAYVPMIVQIAHRVGKTDETIWKFSLREKREINKWANRFKARPVHFFYRRLLFLEAGGVLDSNFQLAGRVNYDLNGIKLIEKFRKEYSRFTSLFSLVSHEHESFKRKHSEWFSDFLKVFVIAEAINFDKRAETLRRYHPLGMQIDVKRGVANGVLVARSLEACAHLLEDTLLNKAKFDIETETWGEDAATVLIEQSSRSRYRVVTANPTLTASFWNFFEGR